MQAKVYMSLMRRRRAEFDDSIAAETDPYTAKHTKRLGYAVTVLDHRSCARPKDFFCSDARKTARMAYANIAAGLLEGVH